MKDKEYTLPIGDLQQGPKTESVKPGKKYDDMTKDIPFPAGITKSKEFKKERNNFEAQ